MPTLIVATGDGIFIVRPADGSSVEVRLQGKPAEAIAVDGADPKRVYVGTWGQGLLAQPRCRANMGAFGGVDPAPRRHSRGR